MTLSQMASELSDVTGHPVEVRERAPQEARASVLEDGAPEWLADAMVGLQVAFETGVADLNNDHVARVTGRNSRSL